MNCWSLRFRSTREHKYFPKLIQYHNRIIRQLDNFWECPKHRQSLCDVCLKFANAICRVVEWSEWRCKLGWLIRDCCLPPVAVGGSVSLDKRQLSNRLDEYSPVTPHRNRDHGVSLSHSLLTYSSTVVSIRGPRTIFLSPFTPPPLV